MAVTRILWATKIGEPDHCEQLITECDNRIEAASQWAKANGFDRLRISYFTPVQKPEFGANLLNIEP